MSSPVQVGSQSLFSAGRLSVFAAASVLAVAGSRWLSAGHLELWLALAAIAVAIWHGAFDGVLAEETLQPRLGRHWRLCFYASYLLLGAGVLLLWWCAPVTALTAFLLYSALHFGTESERELSPARLLTGVATGFIPIAAACHWWPQQVAEIFTLMLRDSAAAAMPMTSIAGRVLCPLIIVALLSAWPVREKNWPAVPALLAIELLLFWGCSPIMAFALFFCLWHTPEHMLSTSLDRKGSFQPRLLLTHLAHGTGPWLLSLAGVGVACWLGHHEVHSYLGIVFIALSALTVPHMVLAEFCRRQDGPLRKPQEFIQASQQLVIR